MREVRTRTSRAIVIPARDFARRTAEEAMSAEERIKAADPAGALEALQSEIRANPADPKRRIFLFQLLLITGQWQRAQTQLDLIADMDDEALAMVKVYGNVIACELHREAVFAGRSKPLVMGEPQPWMAQLIAAQQASAQGDYERFAALNAEAFENAPASSGRLDGQPFAWLADADQRFGPVFEMIFNQHYYWVPASNIRSLEIEEPTDLRDLVWVPATATWTNGGTSYVFIPSRYPRTEGATGPDLMAQHTDWIEPASGIFEGIGQRMLATDQQEYPLLQVRSIEFDA